jgi:hypothetical protein
MHIDAYHFGHIVIDGVAYDDDVILTPGGVRKGWWRKEGHEVSLFDLADLLDPPPARLIVGTGAHGQCRVLEEVETFCRRRGIEILALPTPEAVVEYNSLADATTTIAALHVTC